jgi:hypothetical protein
MFKNPEFETLKERLRKLKLIRRKEKDELKRLEIDEKIDKYQDKIDIIKEKFLEKGWVEGKNGFELADDDDDDDNDDDDDDDDDKDNSNKPINNFLYFVLLISGFIIGSYYIYLNSAANTMLICNVAVLMFPGIYGLIFGPDRRYQFRIKLTKFLRPLFLGILVGVIGSFCYFFNNLLPSGLDWGPLLLILIFCIYSVVLLGISGYIDVFKFLPEQLVFFVILLYSLLFISLVFVFFYFLVIELDNYFKSKRNGIRATEINFINHLGTKL